MATTTNVFKDETTLGNELVRFHRQHASWRTDKFLKSLLAPHLMAIINSLRVLEKTLPDGKKEEKKGKKK